MTVSRYRRALDARHVVSYSGYQRAVFVRSRVAHRVRHVKRRGSAFKRDPENRVQELRFGARRIFRGELHLGAERARKRNGRSGRRDDLRSRHPQLVLHVEVGRGEKDVYPGVRRWLHCSPAPFNVSPVSARQPTDDGTVDSANLTRNLVHGGPVAFRSSRKSRLDHIDPEPRELVRDGELLLERHRAPGCLLAVAERGVEDVHATIVGREGAPLPASRRPASLSHALAAPGRISLALTKVIIRRSDRPTSSMR